MYLIKGKSEILKSRIIDPISLNLSINLLIFNANVRKIFSLFFQVASEYLIRQFCPLKVDESHLKKNMPHNQAS